MKPFLQSSLLLALASVAPFLSLYAGNIDESVDIRELAVFSAATFATCWVPFALIQLWRRPQGWGISNALAVFVAFFYAHYDVCHGLNRLGVTSAWQPALWLLALLLTTFVVLLFGTRRWSHEFLLLFMMLRVASSLFSIATYPGEPVGPGLPIEEAYPLANNGIWSGELGRAPNVYWIVLDGYPRGDQLQSAYGFDNGPFLETLGRAGFFVDEYAWSNLNRTKLSIPTTLEMNYLFRRDDLYAERVRGGRIHLPGKSNRTLTDGIAGDNRTVGMLKQVGYRYVHIDNGVFEMFRCRGFEDECISLQSGRMSHVSSTVLRLTPYFAALSLFPKQLPIPEPMRISSGTGIPELRTALESLESKPPYFVYAHLMTPHIPYRNDADCRRLPLNYVRGREGLEDQVRCVNRQIKGLLYKLRSKDPGSIIVVSADHGARHSIAPDTPLDDLSHEQVLDSLAVLHAIRAPKGCHQWLPRGRSTVNTMRFVFACIGDHPPTYLADRFYMSPFGPHHPELGRLHEVFPR